MAAANISEIKNSLRELYLADSRPWLVGFSGGKDSTLVAQLIFDVVQGIPAEQRKKEIAVVCADIESHRAHGLPDDLLNILKDDLVEIQRN